MTTSINKGKKTNNNIDILKYIMSIMIIMIHVGVAFNQPILRCAVPVFFIISSYFFFKGIKKLNDKEALNSYKKFLRRACSLYLFWFIVLFPYMIISNWLKGDLRLFFTQLPFNLILRSTFPASWYIAAYIIGISLIFRFRQDNIILLTFSLIFYFLCCYLTNYGNLFFVQNTIRELFDSLNPLVDGYLRTIYLSFPVGLIFIWIGKWFVEKNAINILFSVFGVVFGAILLYFENMLIVSNNWRIVNDCYISMLILAPAIFMFILSLPQIITFDLSILRKMSTIYYCSHIPSMVVLGVINKYLGLEVPTLGFFLETLIVCTIIALIFIRLAKLPKLSIFKYSY